MGLPLNIDIQQILLHLFNFAILFVGLYLILYKPVKDFMDKRTEELKKEIDDADKKLKDAEIKEKEYQEKLEAVDQEIVSKKRKAEADIEKIKTEEINAAKKEAEKILDNAGKQAKALKESIVRGAEKDINIMVEEASKKMMLNYSTEATFDAFLDEAKKSLEDGSDGND